MPEYQINHTYDTHTRILKIAQGQWLLRQDYDVDSETTDVARVTLSLDDLQQLKSVLTTILNLEEEFGNE